MVCKLDIGCGSGLPLELTPDRKRYHNWLVENGGQDVIGIDIDYQKVESMRQRVPEATRVVLCDAHSLPWDDGFFDEIHIGAALHHMNNWHLALKEAARVLKPGGNIYIIESVDNDPLFKMFRTIGGSFRGDGIESHFKSTRLIREVSKYFQIKYCQHYWRFYLSDFLLQYNKEPALSVRFNALVNALIPRRFQLNWASHVVIEGVRK